MKKILLLFVALTAIGVNAQTKKNTKTVAKSTVKGTILYKANSNAPVLADAGTLVIFHKSNVVIESEQDTLSKFRIVILAKQLYDLSKKAEHLENLKALNAETDEKFEVIDDKATMYYFRTLKDPKTITTTVDGTGKYAIELKPGRYEVIFKSANLPSVDSVLEVEGKFQNYFIDVKAGETKIQDHIFKKY
jgi:hypothetical protein